MAYSIVSLSTAHEANTELQPEPEMATENDQPLPSMLSIKMSVATEAQQSLEVDIWSVDDTVKHIKREQEMEEMLSRVEMRIQSILEGDPIARFRWQLQSLRRSELDPCRAAERESRDYTAPTSNEGTPVMTKQSPRSFCSTCGTEYCRGLTGQCLYCHTLDDHSEPVAVGELGSDGESSFSTEVSFSDNDEDDIYARQSPDYTAPASNEGTPAITKQSPRSLCSTCGTEYCGGLIAQCRYYLALDGHPVAVGELGSDGESSFSAKLSFSDNDEDDIYARQSPDYTAPASNEGTPAITKQSPRSLCSTCGTEYCGGLIAQCRYYLALDGHPVSVGELGSDSESSFSTDLSLSDKDEDEIYATDDAERSDTASSFTSELSFDDNDDGYKVYATVHEGSMENYEIPLIINVARKKQKVDPHSTNDANTSTATVEQCLKDLCRTCGTQLGDYRFRGLEAGECLYCRLYDHHPDPVEDASDSDTAPNVTPEPIHNHHEENDGYEVYVSFDVGSMDKKEIPLIMNVASTKQIVDADPTSDTNTSPAIVEQSPKDLCRTCGTQLDDCRFSGLEAGKCLLCRIFDRHSEPVEDAIDSDTAPYLTPELTHKHHEDDKRYEEYETVDGGSMDNNEILLITNVASTKQIIDADSTSDANTSPAILEQSPKDLCRTCGAHVGDHRFRGIEAGKCLLCRIFDCHPDPFEDASHNDVAPHVTSELTYNHDNDGDRYEVNEIVDDDSMENNEIPVIISVASKRRLDDDSDLIMPDAARLDSIMEMLINDISSTPEPKRTSRNIARALGARLDRLKLQTI